MDVRNFDVSEVEGFIAVLENAFGFEAKDERRHEFTKHYELDRLFGAFEGETMVGSGGAFTFDLTVPGGTVGCGGTTVVAVLPTHRRRGVLTEMMRYHLAEVDERREPVAALWASEAPIYGRFGYGVASQFMRIKIDRDRISFPRSPLGNGTVRLIDRAEAEKLLPDVYERQRLDRPGFVTRPPNRWEWAFFHDPPDWRDGGTPRRYAVYEDGGDPLGYVTYRQHERWENGLPANRVSAGPIHALTPAAEDALWRYLVGIDLVATIEAWNGDPNSVLPHLVTDARRIERLLSDGMWVRIIDVPAALAARRYRAEGSLVFEVVDPFFGRSAGTFRLEGGPDGAECGPTSAEPDLRLDVRELGSMYLGGVSATELSRAGLLGAEEPAVRRADLMFGWHLEPWCPEVF